jgi:hypothetical protein
MRSLFTTTMALLLSGCTANNELCLDCETKIGVADQLLISRAVDGVAAGFDFDGKTSSEGGGTGCGIADYTGVNGEDGVDNAIARLIPVLELTEAIVVEELILQAINSGELLLLFRLTDLAQEDGGESSVSLEVLRGIGEPIVGSDGFIVSGQTYDIDASVPIAAATDLPFTNNTVIAHGLTLEVPITIFDASLTAVLENASARVEWTEDGLITGYFGGALDYWSIVDMALNSNVDPTLAASLPGLFDMNADLAPDSTGACSRISFTFTFEGKSAFLFDE